MRIWRVGSARNAVFFHSFEASESLKSKKFENRTRRLGDQVGLVPEEPQRDFLRDPERFRNLRIFRNGDNRGPTLSCNGTQQGPTRRCPLSYVVLQQGTTGDRQVEPWKIFGCAFAKVIKGPQRGTR